MGKSKILPDGKPVHFIGVGGISMSALADILLDNGYSVSGSDINYSDRVKELCGKGLEFYDGHRAENVKNAGAVIQTMAVNDENPEIKEAKRLKIPVIRRSELLGEIMGEYEKSVAVAGTHGKTTVTSMLSYIFEKTGADPTILVGAELDIIDGNVKTGKSDYFIAEACEYHRSFLDFKPYCEVILNVEPDHLDYYKDADDYHSAYRDFLELLNKDGFAVLCADDEELMKMKDIPKCRVVTYGTKNADFTAKNVTVGENGTEYDIYIKEEKICKVRLSVFGKHNVLNSLAALACAYMFGLDMQAAADALSEFKGAGRRFEYKGKINGASVYDDYAHHPTEIRATLDTTDSMIRKRVICVFQPHTYSRTKTFRNEFAEILSKTDITVLADIYAAREKDDGSINSAMLREDIEKLGGNAYYFDSFAEITEFVRKNAQPDDIVIVMGAGNIVNITKEILK